MSKSSSFSHKLYTFEKRKLYSFFSWIILLLAVGYLVFKLYEFDSYNELSAEWRKMPLKRFGWLLFVLILLPFNWFFETIKWKKIVSKTENISIAQSFKAVMTGFSTGFLTPNRTGDFIGRLIFLHPENRKTGVTLSFINSLSQNIVIALCGIPASIFFFLSKTSRLNFELTNYYILLVIVVAFIIILFFALPYLVKSKHVKWLSTFTTGIHLIRTKDLLLILLYSLLRYTVFCIQFYAIILFFGVNLEPWQALIAIPANYLFVTFTPSVAFSEAAVRSSYAVFFIGAFSTNVLNIALAGILIWVINFVIPMLIGSVLIVKPTKK